MIKFFRRIRKKLIDDKHFARYLTYAFGEVILVVLGILIALQINNWNETSKSRKKERLILKELLISINADIYTYEKFLEPRLVIKSRGIDSLKNYIFSNRHIEDSVFLKHFDDMKQDLFLRFDNGPFEALKSSGLDLIKNDSLRTLINSAYTVKLPNLVYFGNDHYNQSMTKIGDLYYKVIGLEKSFYDDGRKFLGEALIVDNVLSNSDFLWILKLEESNYFTFVVRLEQMKNQLKILKKAVEIELE